MSGPAASCDGAAANAACLPPAPPPLFVLDIVSAYRPACPPTTTTRILPLSELTSGQPLPPLARTLRASREPELMLEAARRSSGVKSVGVEVEVEEEEV